MLIEKPTRELLERFGAGEHKPGSGSAAAFGGMLSAKLALTVISLTLEPKRSEAYGRYRGEFEKMDADISQRIYPNLCRLFQEDSELFDEVIKLRTQRNAATNEIDKKRIAQEELDAMVPATETPLEIANLCIDLADHATKIFQFGFRAARGDSGVALSGAVSAVQGCVSIIELNLNKFSPNGWTDKIQNASSTLSSKANRLTQTIVESNQVLREEAINNFKYHERISKFWNKELASDSLRDSDIEEAAINLQRTIWTHRRQIWKKNPPNDPLAVLSPPEVLRAIGYGFSVRETLGQHIVEGEMSEVAGLIDNNDRHVEISEAFSSDVQRFTSAHELGHAIFHEQTVLHRDRPLDGSSSQSSKNIGERQADKFATYFLMPKLLLKQVFKEKFLSDVFVINEATAFALDSSSLDQFKNNYGNLRILSRRLASTDQFNGIQIKSIANEFRVSVEAMAIRIEELDLIQWER